MRRIRKPSSSLLPNLFDTHAQLFRHGDEHGVLILNVTEDLFYLLLGPDIDFQIALGTGFRMLSLKILPHHDERHQQYLYHIGDEEPQHEPHRRIELQPRRSKQVPTEPERSPNQNKQEKSDRADPLRDEHREPAQ